jgi:mercuric ion binding protein
MLRFSFLLAVLFTAISFGKAQANTHTVTKHFTVEGVCEQCKARIENASYVKGVKFADWNVKTHDLTVKYDSTKTSPEVILKAVAKSGHDNELYKADKEDYEKIAKCCKYRSGEKMH